MNEPKNRTPINLKNGVKTTREEEAVFFLYGTHKKLLDHRHDFVDQMGEKQGRAQFQTNCGELYSFIEERIREGLESITVRIIGRSKQDKNFLQFAFTDKDGMGHSCTVHRDCLHEPKQLHPSQFLYEPVSPEQVAA